MKLLFYSDLHLRSTGSFPPYNAIDSNGLTKELNNFITGFDFVRDCILTHKPAAVFCLGDVFHLTETQTTLTLHGCYLAMDKVDKACKELGIEHHIMFGQHDLVNEIHKVTSISLLNGFGKVHVEDSIVDINGFRVYLIPFKTSKGRLYTSLVEAQTVGDLICTHADFMGVKYENGANSESALSAELTKTCISGDIHLPQRVGSVTYPGSLLQHRFSQYDLERVGGCLIYNTDDQRITHIPNTYSKHYVKVRDLQKGLSFDPSKVLLQIVSSTPREEVDKLFKDYEYWYLPEIQAKEAVNRSYESFSLHNPKTLLTNYIREHRPEALTVVQEVLKTEVQQAST